MNTYPTSTVFMLAPQRHGSNKTQSMLSANNPHLFGPYPPVIRQKFQQLESHLGSNLLEAMVHNANLSPRPLMTSGKPLTPASVRSELAARQLPENALGISLALCHLGAKASGFSSYRVLCKSPDNLGVVEAHHAEFRDTAYLHLIRDPRAVWNSGRGTPRGPQTPHAAALKWADYHARVHALAGTIPIITLTYEQLMLHPETELQRACRFLDIPFSEDMLEGHGSADARKAASTNPGLWGNLAKPILHSRIDAWKQELPSEEIDIIENTCAEVMEAYGYAPLFPSRQLTEAEKGFKPIVKGKAPTGEPRKAQLEHLTQWSSALGANSAA